MQPIYHITSTAEAEEARRAGNYSPPTLADEGFIHCSYLNQVTDVAARYYRGQADLTLLEIDRAMLPCRVVDENLLGGEELFPHIYGRLPMAAVVCTHQFPCNADGCFELPPALSSENRSQ